MNLVTMILVCAVAVAACNPHSTGAVSTVNVSTASAPPPPPQTSGGGCEHEYFPADEDATWEYAGTTNVFGPHHTTRTITEARDDGFTMSQSTSAVDVVLNLEYACTDGSLILLDPMEQFAGSATGSSGKAVVTVQDQSGITLPADLQAGLTWQRYVEGTVTAPNVTLQLTYTFDSVARGLEVVTVPMGTFDAMRVDTETKGTLEGEDSGTCQTSTWYVKDIGVVKESTSCGSGANAVEISIELESYDSP